MGGALSGSSSSSNGNNNNNNNKSKKSSVNNNITEIDRAILDLKNARDKLTKYNLQLETSIDKLMVRAKRAKQDNRTSTALGLLRLKKYKQDEVNKIQTQLLNVHQLIETIDSQQRNAQIIASLKAGKDALAQLHEETSVDDVLNLMDEISEQHEVEQEISNILNNALPNTLSAEQEASIEAELEALQQEMMPTTEKQKEEAKQADLELPTAPTDKLPQPSPQQPQKVAEEEQEKQPERVPIAG